MPSAGSRATLQLASDTRSSPSLSGAERPTLESVTRLTREYELGAYLSSDWALRPVEFVREGGRTMLVVDYAGGEPLIASSARPWRSDDSCRSR